MRRTASAMLAATLAVMLGIQIGYTQTSTYTMQAGEQLNVACQSGLSGTVGAQTASLICATLAPTLTATMTPTLAATATHTHTPAPAGHPLGWHPPTDHEHGDAPPAWVTASTLQPFTQSRESHTGYKGVLASDRGGKGVQSYLITHIISTAFARSHGDHDYQIWFRHPDGTVVATEGILPFSPSASNPTLPIPQRTSDTGERPIVLAERTPTDGCEVWYSAPGRLPFDLGWVICSRLEKFDGSVIPGNNGSIRTMDWVLVASRLPAGHPLRLNCTVEFNVCRHSFLVDTKDYNAPGVVAPN